MSGPKCPRCRPGRYCDECRASCRERARQRRRARLGERQCYRCLGIHAPSETAEYVPRRESETPWTYPEPP